MYHRIHPAQAIHVVSDAALLRDVGQVADDGCGAPVDEVADRFKSSAVASVDDDLVPLVEQRLRGRPSEAVCGAGDEDTRYPSLNAR